MKNRDYPAIYSRVVLLALAVWPAPWAAAADVPALALAPIADRPFSAIAAIASSGSSGPAVGTIAPDFSARNLLTGEKIPLSKQRGKVVILTFWASWCGPCRRELPILEKAQEIIGQERLTVLAVSYHENPDAERALKKLASTWLQTIPAMVTARSKNSWTISIKP